MPDSIQVENLARALDGTKDVEERLKKFKNQVIEATKCGIDNINCSKYNSAYKYYLEGKIPEAHQDLFEAERDLIVKIANEKWFIFPNMKWIWYFNTTRGIIPMAFAVICLAVFASLLARYHGLLIGQPLIVHHIYSFTLEFPSEILGVPLWAAFSGGVGASTQILIGVANDSLTDGIMTEYKRTWYIVLPIVALVFGYLAYILIDLGTQGDKSASLIATNISLIKVTGANSFNLIHNETGNYSFTAGVLRDLTATGMGSFVISIGNLFRVFTCFMAGFASNEFIKRLASASPKA